MLRFSGEIGQPVQKPDGSRLGLLRDLTIDIDDEPLVRRLVVGTKRRINALVDWEAVASFESTLVQLGPVGHITEISNDSNGELPLGQGELLLARDVLDTQVVDIEGSRLARVGDILLTRLPDDRLEVGAVDVGFGSVCRRLGLSWTADHMNEEALGWGSIHLTSARGHQVQLTTSKAAMHRLDGQELAALLSRLSVASGAEVLGAVHPSRAGVALAESHPEVASSLMAALEEHELVPALDALPKEKALHLRSVRERPRPLRLLRHRERRSRHGRSGEQLNPSGHKRLPS